MSAASNLAEAPHLSSLQNLDDEACAQGVEAVVRTLEARQFQEWAGLGDTCTLTALGRVVPRAHAEPRRRWLGAKRQRMAWAGLDLPGYEEPVRAWTRSGGEEVCVLECIRPDVPGGLETLLRALGRPAASPNVRRGRQVLQEWVYPDRGLAVVSDERGEIVRLVLFRPTTLLEYWLSWRPELSEIDG